MINGEAAIPKDQLPNIINMDEICLPLDGINGTQGGHPEAIFYNPNLPRAGQVTGKSTQPLP